MIQKETRKLVLASTSEVRKQLLTKAGLKFETASPTFDEEKIKIDDPKKLVQILALGKAKSIKSKYKQSIIIGSDTVVSFENQILGKPKTEERAYQMLEMIQAKWNIGYTGLALIDTTTGKEWVGVGKTEVKIRKLTDDEIWGYIKSGEPLNKAGAYSEAKGSMLIEQMQGDIFAVQGLPLPLLAKVLLSEFNYNYWTNWINNL
jgi:septum formation protein